MEARRRERRRDAVDRELPAATLDGQQVAVLANVASVAELELALSSGAEGIGLLRTELAFLDASEWPSESEHMRAIEPILQALGPRPAIVRVLDFGADKCPPFLAGNAKRGLALLLDHEAAFAAQLRAVLHAARDRDLRILLPMVDDPAQLTAARELLDRTARELGIDRAPPLGAMIESRAAAKAAHALASRGEFLSIGTNDLTAEALAADRFRLNEARTHDPTVLRLIARSVAAAHEAHVDLEVCGEAASDPLMLALLVGLEVDQLSVGAARVGEVRRWVRALRVSEARDLAALALEMDGADEVEAAVAPLARRLQSGEGGHAAAQGVEGSGRILAFGA
jgi:phosphoenolpyruvate-protein kinase (PTS system EI component)